MTTDEYNEIMEPLKFLKGNTYLNVNRATEPDNFNKDIYGLKKYLSPNHLSSVYVVNDTKNPRLFKVLVFGEKNTPYHNCGFMFGIFLSENYPQNPPEIITDILADSQALSPFIFSQGRVLLPVLGNYYEDIFTNVWNSSTQLCDIINDIKKIFCIDEPYFADILNQENRESVGKKTKSKEYTQRARMISVAEGIVGILQDEIAFDIFNKVIILHFLLKYNEIISTLDLWLSEIDENLSLSSHVYKEKSFKNWVALAKDLLKTHKEKYIN